MFIRFIHQRIKGFICNCGFVWDTNLLSLYENRESHQNKSEVFEKVNYAHIAYINQIDKLLKKINIQKSKTLIKEEIIHYLYRHLRYIEQKSSEQIDIFIMIVK